MTSHRTDPPSSDHPSSGSPPSGPADHLLSRRGLLAGAGLGALVPGWLVQHVSSAAPRAVLRPRAAALRGTPLPPTYVASPDLAKFVRPLRGLFPADPDGIPVAASDGTRSWLGGRLKARHYTVDLRQFTDVLHPDLPPTTLWGYHATRNVGGRVPQRHLAGFLVAEKGVPVQITFRNFLPPQHILPVDDSLMGADGAHNRAVVHLHGGAVPWISDGGPFTWFRPCEGPHDPGPFYGPAAEDGGVNVYRLLDRRLPVGSAEVWYPMRQSARFLWYHDHAIGTTRLNAYAGLATGVLLRDGFERALVKLGLPEFAEKGGRELPLVVQEKIFAPADDPTFPGSARTAGSLWYPYRYDTSAFGSAPGTDPGLLPVSAIPEMFGDTMLVNGVVHPRVTVEPRRYRLRILNATQARFLDLGLYAETAPGSGVPDLAAPGPDWLVLGTEGGFLARPVVVPSRPLDVTAVVDDGTGEVVERTVDPAAPGGSLLTGPAERWDVLVDFSAFAGRSLLLYNDAPAPFPGGGPEWDGPVDENGVVLNQRLLRFDVAPAVTGRRDPALRITPATPLAASRASGIDPALVGSWASNTTAPLPVPAGVTVRNLTLNELFDEKGRLIQMLGTDMFAPPPPGYTVDPEAMGYPLTAAMMYTDAATERPAAGAVEVWRIANLSMDVHPMHFHLVNVQVLSRQPFADYMVHDGMGMPMGLGPERGPDATELGWKETVRMNPMEVTTVVMRFDLPPVPFDVPQSPRTGGHEFVWHCHILEHEEHDMMRPLVVDGRNPRLR